MKILVGYTGFVGSNIQLGTNFDGLYNSKNIEEAYGTNPDILVYSGLRAEKYLANLYPDQDMELIYQAEENIKRINPKKIVLISTIDVFKNPQDVTECTCVATEGLQAYGYNRYKLECWIKENYSDYLIIRLPGLFGKNIKKNFIYDFINLIPGMLTEEKMEEISLKDPELKNYYELQNNGFYKIGSLSELEKENIKERFKKIGFSALNFTDSKNVYQFYPLERLWDDIQLLIEKGIKIFHPATEPVSAGEIYKYVTGEEFINNLSLNPVNYDYKTVHYKLFEGKNGYILNKDEVLKKIKEFIDSNEHYF